MRTTLDIADDVLAAVKEHARRENRTAGEIASDLLRLALTAPPRSNVVMEPEPIYGLKPFPARGAIVTNDLINQLRSEDVY